MTIEEAADALVGALDSRFLKALAEPMRIELVKLLILHGPSNVNDLVTHLPRERSVISRHLKVMLDADLLSVTQDGRNRIYDLNAAHLLQGIGAIQDSARSLISLCCPDQIPPNT